MLPRLAWRRIALIGLGSLTVAVAVTAAPAQAKELALLVGIDGYPAKSGLRTLPYAAHDVEDLAELLLAYGYRPENVRLLTPQRGSGDPRLLPTASNIRRELEGLTADRVPEDSLVVALSGHGIARKPMPAGAGGRGREQGAGLFCPIDADPSSPDSCLSIGEFYRRLEPSKAGLKLLLIDASRNEPSQGTASPLPFRTEPPPPSVVALFACSDGEVARDSETLGGGRSVFFHYVIDGLKGSADAEAGNGDGKITLAELGAYTQARVREYVSFRWVQRQMPLVMGTTGRPTLLEFSSARPARLIISKSTGAKLNLIPSGEFLMGSSKADDPDAAYDEMPRHAVRITRPFYLATTETTIRQFRRVAESSGIKTQAEIDGEGSLGWNEKAMSSEGPDPKYTWKFTGYEQTDDHPVVNVSWNDAIEFCNKLSVLDRLKPYYRSGGEIAGGDGYRLPTEAEWEYACRAGTKTRYESGNDPETLAQVGNIADGTARLTFPNWTTIAAQDGSLFTAPAGRFRPNAFGLYDMHGNVWEWCWDRYQASYYAESPAADPRGPGGVPDRVFRGGCWVSPPRFARSAVRYMFPQAYRNYGLGFRVARDGAGLK
jgi:formylglycine-generating enzyme required for sulfatase activity/uncharacterized caspase-like protein